MKMVIIIIEDETEETLVSPIMMGVPSVRKWLASSLPLEASSDPRLHQEKRFIKTSNPSFILIFILLYMSHGVWSE